MGLLKQMTQEESSRVMPSSEELSNLAAQRKLANSVHHARVRIRQRHLSVGRQLVNIPSFMVTKSSEAHIKLAPTSVFSTGKPGRVQRKKNKGGAGGDE